MQMKLRHRIRPAGLTASFALAAALGVAPPAMAQGVSGDLQARLSGYQEVPAVSTAGEGRFRAEVARDGSAIEFELRYERLEAGPRQVMERKRPLSALHPLALAEQ